MFHQKDAKKMGCLAAVFTALRYALYSRPAKAARESANEWPKSNDDVDEAEVQACYCTWV